MKLINWGIGFFSALWVFFYLWIFTRARTQREIVPRVFENFWDYLSVGSTFIVLGLMLGGLWITLYGSEMSPPLIVEKFLKFTYHEPRLFLRKTVVPKIPYIGWFYKILGKLCQKAPQKADKLMAFEIVLFLDILPRIFFTTLFFINIILLSHFNYFLAPLIILRLYLFFYKTLLTLLDDWALHCWQITDKYLEMRNIPGQPIMYFLREEYASTVTAERAAISAEWSEYFLVIMIFLNHVKKITDIIYNPYLSSAILSIYCIGLLKICLIFIGIVLPNSIFILFCMLILILWPLFLARSIIIKKEKEK